MPEGIGYSPAAQGLSAVVGQAMMSGPGAGQNPLLALLQSGQFSAESLMQLLSALMGMGAGGMQGPMQGPAPASPIEAAMLGQ